MAHLSLECSSSQKRNACGALERISHVLRGLDDGLVELGQIHNMLEQETMRACNNGIEDVELVDLLLVAGTLRKMVGVLISDVRADPEMQRVLQVTSREDFATFQHNCNKIWKEPTLVKPGAESGIPDSGSLTSVAESQATRNSRHGLDLDPLVWRRLPDHLLGLVFARLPLPEMFLIPRLSKAWLATSKIPSFRQLCAAYRCESKLFGIVSFNPDVEEFWVAAFDVNAQKWHYRELEKSFAFNYWNHMFAHDGGLVCFVSNSADSIVIGNPLTSLWKRVPLLAHEKKLPFMVQLVRNAETGCYRVMVVFRSTSRYESFLADCYDSKTGLWSTLTSGHVYSPEFAVVFDCQQGIVFDNSNELIPPLEGDFEDYAVLGNRIIVMHECSQPRRSNDYNVTEFAWESSTSTFSRRLKSHECQLLKAPEFYRFLVFASSDFILLVANLVDSYEPYHHQFLRLFDRTTQDWHDVPALKSDSDSYLYPANMLRQEFGGDSFMCDLRWDAFP